MVPAWFTDAKFGIFIHWGIYSEGKCSESWAFFGNEIPYDEYMAQAQTFTAANYDPDAWADLFARAGAKYVVLTTKHHDGFALWDTKLSKLNAVDGSPAGRDLIGPYCDALRKRGLKVGLYFSHLDWSHPDYASVLPKGAQPHDHSNKHSNKFAYPQGEEDPAAWARFIDFHRGQLKELCTRYQPDLLWFDGDWERDPEQFGMKELRDQLREWAPGVILNSRMGGYGDYGTPEQAMPVTKPVGPWEFCVTINDSWNYQKKDTNHKTVRQCLRMLVECIAMGGNILLDVGPKSDGSLQTEQIAVLEGMGRWTAKHADAIYGTIAGLPAGQAYSPTALSADQTSLFVYLLDRPVDGIAIKGIKNTVKRVSVVGMDIPDLTHKKIGGAPWAGLPGIFWADVPETALDPDITVLRIDLDGPIDLYTGAGDTVTMNV